MRLLSLKNIILSSAFLLSATLSTAAQAASTYTGPVSVECGKNQGLCFVRLLSGTPPEGSPGCAGSPTHYVLPMTSPLWEEMLAIAMDAQRSNKDVCIAGAGVCTQRDGDHEDLDYISLLPN